MENFQCFSTNWKTSWHALNFFGSKLSVMSAYCVHCFYKDYEHKKNNIKKKVDFCKKTNAGRKKVWATQRRKGSTNHKKILLLIWLTQNKFHQLPWEAKHHNVLLNQLQIYRQHLHNSLWHSYLTHNLVTPSSITNQHHQHPHTMDIYCIS